MKYVQSFDKIYEITNAEKILAKKTKQAANTAITLESILKTFFALFMDISAIKQIWKVAKNEKKLLPISIDIYNHLIDISAILELPKNMQLKYATNLGIEVNKDTNVIAEIIKQLYIQNYKRNFDEDLEETVKYLETGSNFESFKPVHEMFLKKIKEIQKIL